VTTLFRLGIAAAVRGVAGAHLIKTAAAFCDARLCSMVHGGKLLYRDEDHLNIAGSRYVARLIRADPMFAAALRGQGAGAGLTGPLVRSSRNRGAVPRNAAFPPPDPVEVTR
jgi:SGNH domain (fused to AT3 domains)